MQVSTNDKQIIEKLVGLQKRAIDTIFDQREKFIIIGLTGKIGSGCSTVARQCEKKFEELKLACPQPPMNGAWTDKERDSRIIQRFYQHHMANNQFYVIKVRSIILSFLLEDEHTFNRLADDLEERLHQENTVTEQGIIEAFNEKKQELYKSDQRFKKAWDKYPGKRERFNEIQDLFALNNVCRERSEEKAVLRFYYMFYILPYIGQKVHEDIKEVYTELFQNYGNELRFFGSLNKNDIENFFADSSTSDRITKNLYTISERINCFIKAVEYRNGNQGKEATLVIIDSMKNLYESSYLKDRYSSYYLVAVSKEEKLRKEEIRRNKPYYSEEDIQYLDFNERPNEARKKLGKFLNICIHDKSISDDNSGFKTRIEALEEGDYKKFFNSGSGNLEEDGLNLNKVHWDLKFQRAGINEELFKYYKRILNDDLRIFMYHEKLQQIYLQDVESCIQNADIFLANNETGEEPHDLNLSIIRYISLMMHPGLVVPTEVERCMQIAYAAKVNSGCISRQVGAVVTDSEYNILSLGWNDVPCGQVLCNRRNLLDLSRSLDKCAYSDYENGPRTSFRNVINGYGLDKLSADDIRGVLNGLPAAFCFKDIHEEVTGEKNPMDARSMHGEEKALLACDQQRVQGGYLFTTSSPCEMCAKNAKDHHINKIYYIEPYPGISQSHVCNSGDIENRAQYELFEGAIGRAYTQLYTPIMPYKDELKLRGIDELKGRK